MVLGKRDEARAYLERILSLKADFSGMDEVKQLLAKLDEKKEGENSDEDKAVSEAKEK